MAITRFQDLPSTNTPINSTNLNGNFDELGVKVGTSVDNNYRTNIIKTNNLIPTYVELSATYTYSGAGEWISSTNYITMKFIPVEPNTTYTFKSNADTTKYAQARVYNFNSSKDWISRSDTYTITDGAFTFTTGNTTEYIGIGLYTSSTASLGDITQYQLNEGSTALSYEPYIRSINVDGEEIYSKDNLEQYSTNETRIGTWIDGKPLYRKVLTGTTVIGSTLVFTIPNIETFVELSGIIKVQDNYVNPLPFYESAEVFGRIQGYGNNITVITSSSEYANGSTMIIAKYTKTTD